MNNKDSINQIYNNNIDDLQKKMGQIEQDIKNIDRKKRELIAHKYNLQTQIINIERYNKQTWRYSWFN